MKITVDEVSYEFEYTPAALQKLPLHVMTLAIQVAEEEHLRNVVAPSWKLHGLEMSRDCTPTRRNELDRDGLLAWEVAVETTCEECAGRGYCTHCKSNCAECDGSGANRSSEAIVFTDSDLNPVFFEEAPE